MGVSTSTAVLDAAVRSVLDMLTEASITRAQTTLVAFVQDTLDTEARADAHWEAVMQSSRGPSMRPCPRKRKRKSTEGSGEGW
jgi:hypothetical protein